ncbi:HEAT repeat domain-containing protein [Smaragdicoccus niigatensis]|uniref:HEAT repeat domain-containing protein n=1 Tax=Smaragdicoccus niigatensis TaxID=359359 RepID=UPI00036D3AC3|nr:HEAT repeat domain-containing protein [Smaragdicoccus niigatensis]
MSKPSRLASTVRIRSLLSLSAYVTSTADVATYLADPDAEVRRTALALVVEATEDWAGTTAAVSAALTDRDASVRRLAIDLLRELGTFIEPSEIFDNAIREAAAHNDADVRAAALAALWRQSITSLGELRGWRSDPSPEVRQELVSAFVSFDGLTELIAMRTDTNPAVRQAVATGLGRLGDPRGAIAAAELAVDNHVSVRVAALHALARTGLSNSAGEVAAKSITSAFWEVRAAAAGALGAENRDFVLPALARAAADKNDEVRRAAVRTLAEKFPDHPIAHDLLTQASSDPDPAVAAYAKFGIGTRPRRTSAARRPITA